MPNANNTTPKPSRSERTNAKNQENTHVANTIVAAVGTIFKPTSSLIEKAALTTFEQNFTAKSESVITANVAEANAVDAQIAAFKQVSKRVTLIMKAVRAQGLTNEFIEGLQSHVNRLNGVRINKTTPDATPGETPEKSASVSRRSYAGILESLNFIVAALQSNAAFDPNEAEFKTAAIAAWVESLVAVHNAALEAKINTRTVRNERNAYAYNDTDGLIPRMKLLKNYLGYILDKNDPRLKQMKSLKFVDNTK